jgi:Zn-dependent peptidase ImmA (M78 family)
MRNLPLQDITDVIDRVIEQLLDAAGCTSPPVDAIALAQRHLGMVVCQNRRQEQRGKAQRSAGLKQIVLRPEPTEERHQWTVAHEIGEYHKAVLLERLGIAPERTAPLAGESLANLFAYRLLLPSCWFAADARRCRFDLAELKQRYGTASHEVIAWRLLDLSEPCIITVIDNDHVSKRRSNAWPANRLLSPAEDECRRYVNSYSRPYFFRKENWTVQGWPIHQTDWKREILRSVIDCLE